MPTATRQQRAAATRGRILEAAAEVFAESGYEGGSMRAIARRADVAVGTVFTVAPSKAALLQEVLYDSLEAVVLRSLETPSDVPLIDQLVAMGGCFFDWYAARPALSRALLSGSLMATGERGGRLRAQVEGVARGVAERAAVDLQRDPRGGLSPADIALGFVAAYYFALLSGLGQTQVDPAQQRALLRRQLAALLREENR